MFSFIEVEEFRGPVMGSRGRVRFANTRPSEFFLLAIFNVTLRERMDMIRDLHCELENIHAWQPEGKDRRASRSVAKGCVGFKTIQLRTATFFANLNWLVPRRSRGQISTYLFS